MQKLCLTAPTHGVVLSEYNHVYTLGSELFV